jgi:hypothetical protein
MVRVGKTLEAGGVRYSYHVANGGAFPIVSVVIGFDYVHDEPGLMKSPVGWLGDGVPPTSVTIPTGWEFNVIPMEEHDTFSIEWSIDTTLAMRRSVLGGESLGGFSILVPEEDANYEQGRWTVYLDAGEEPAYYASLVPDASVAVAPSSMFNREGIRLSPNPGKGAVRIECGATAHGRPFVDIFDGRGRRVRSLSPSLGDSGSIVAIWDGRTNGGDVAPAGTYFVRVKFVGGQRFAKLVRL